MKSIGQRFPDFVRRLGLEIISLLIPIGIYATVLIQPIPADIALNFRFALFPGVFIFTILLFFALQLKGYLGRTISLSLTLVLFALPLAALWNTGISTGLIIGGLLPWTDAYQYYWDARRLLQGEPLYPTPDHQRPLATGFLATLLWLTQLNLQVTLALLVFTAAITSFLASRVLQRSHGPLAAVLLLVGLFAFYQVFSGTLMTETLGLALGCLGFATLWYGAHTRQLRFALAGLFFFSLGMNARISAIFILPMILMWGIWYFRQQQRLSWQFALNGAGAILLAFLLNGGLRKLIAAPGTVPLSNFSYTLYGILTGNSWTTIFQDYPELNQMNSSERISRAYALCWQLFQENPSRLITGILRSWQEFFWGEWSSFLVYAPRGNLDYWFSLLLLFGLFACWRRRRHADGVLTLCLGLGVFFSIPLLPIWDAGLRPYATVSVIFYLMPALGLAFLAEGITTWCYNQNWFSRNVTWRQKVQLPSSRLDREIASPQLATYIPLGLGVLITLCCTVAPVVIKVTHHPPTSLANICPAPLQTGYFRLNPGSSINLVRNSSRELSHMPNIRIKDFRQGVGIIAFYGEKIEQAFKALRPGEVLVDAFGGSWLVAKRSILPEKTGDIVACGKLEQYPSSFPSSLYLFRAESIQRLSP